MGTAKGREKPQLQVFFPKCPEESLQKQNAWKLPMAGLEAKLEVTAPIRAPGKGGSLAGLPFHLLLNIHNITLAAIRKWKLGNL